MPKRVDARLHALRRPRNGRPERRTAALVSIAPVTPRRSRGILRAIGNVAGRIFGLAAVLALSIVLAHAMLAIVLPA